ncbi:PTS system%2C IIC component%2C GatC %2Cgalactitol-specific IIC component [Streptococcus pneumoniae]|nr:PTS system%2C IIC component%2C GatC %2Cgalactitol-specific IIC component [Streptococcus pneumoniae]
MLIILTVLALLFGVKFSKALEGGIKLAIALTGIGAIIGMLNTAFSASLAKFVENTGIQLSITDVGWAPLATITWGSAWTLYFLLIMLIVNVVMLAMKKTDTLDVDIFTPIAATDLGFEPGIPVIEAGPILFRIPAMSAPVFDNIEAAIKEHGLS